MFTNDALCDGVRILLKEAVRFLPAKGLGVIREDGPDSVVLIYIDAFGATAYRTRLDGVPPRLAPRHATRELAEVRLDAAHAGLVETRILHTGFGTSSSWWNPPEQSGQPLITPDLHVVRLVAQRVPDLVEPMTFLVALGDDVALTSDQVAGVERLAARLVESVHQTLSLDEERALPPARSCCQDFADTLRRTRCP